MNTPHEILRIFGFLAAMAAGALELPMAQNFKLIRAGNMLLLLILSALLFLTGLADLGSVSFCATSIVPGAWQGAICVLALLGLVVSSSVIACRMILSKWLGKGYMGMGTARIPKGDLDRDSKVNLIVPQSREKKPALPPRDTKASMMTTRSREEILPPYRPNSKIPNSDSKLQKEKSSYVSPTSLVAELPAQTRQGQQRMPAPQRNT